MRYQTEDEILNVVRAFESGTIKRADWRHVEHLTVAVYYAFHLDFKAALAKMRGGIFNLLKTFEIDLTMEMPYHETLTVFWMRTIFDSKANQTSLIEFVNRILEIGGDKDLPLRFYGRELLFSDKARRNFVGGDLSPNAKVRAE